MNILKVGDVKKAACEHCKAFTTATFMLRDVPFSNGAGTAKNVLVGVCNQCDQVSTLPHQSTPAIKKQLDVQRKALESRVPAHIIDILNLASYQLSGNTDFVPNLIKYYIHALAQKTMAASGLQGYFKSDLFQGKAQKRLSIKGRKVLDEIDIIKKMIDIHSTTDLLKSIALKINDDVLVNKKAKTIRDLEGIVAATV